MTRHQRSDRLVQCAAKSSQSLLPATTSRQAPLDVGEAESTRNLASLRGRFPEAGVATQRWLSRASAGVDGQLQTALDQLRAAKSLRPLLRHPTTDNTFR